MAVAAMLLIAALWRPEEPKVYIVNLVPSIAAVGTQRGKSTVTPASREEPAPRVPRSVAPPREAGPPRTAAVREPAAEPAPPIPAPPAPPRPPTPPPASRDAPAALPETLPPRVAAVPPHGAAPSRLSLPAAPAPAKPAPPPAIAAPPLPAKPLPASRLPVRPDGDEPPSRPRVADMRVLRDTAVRPIPSPPTVIARAQPPELPRRPQVFPSPAPSDLPTRPRSSPLSPSEARPASPAPIPAEPVGRPGALPRTGQKELPTLASNVATVAPPPALAAPIPRPAPAVTPLALPAPPPPSPAVTPSALGQPTGSPQGKGAITMTASDFPFAWYLQTIQRKVNERWAPPTRPEQTKAVVVFEIGRDGQLKNPAVEQSSGDALYDQAALRAIMEAHPFPPLPAEFGPPALKIHLGFNFSTDRG